MEWDPMVALSSAVVKRPGMSSGKRSPKARRGQAGAAPQGFFRQGAMPGLSRSIRIQPDVMVPDVGLPAH